MSCVKRGVYSNIVEANKVKWERMIAESNYPLKHLLY